MKEIIKKEQLSLYKGTNTFATILASGYITGSGNYFDFFIPIKIPDGLTVTNIQYNNTSGCLFNGSNISIGTTASVLSQNKAGIICEYHFSTTQAKSNSATASLINATITCS